jgi:ubiquinone/menaquinone biosynthesis C-methylase UbiE
MANDNFWEHAWASQKKTEDTELITIDTQREATDFSYKLLGDIKNKKLLEIGCGSGRQAIELSQRGAQVTSIDIAEESVNALQRKIKENKLKNIKVLKMNGESLTFPNNSFDRVYINCVLMHADKDKVIPESLRVLKKGGILVFKETIKEWLFAFPYRTFSPFRKTEPHYVRLKDIKHLTKEHKEFYLLSTAALFLVYGARKFNGPMKIYNTMTKFDRILLKAFPLLRNVSWVSVAKVTK